MEIGCGGWRTISIFYFFYANGSLSRPFGTDNFMNTLAGAKPEISSASTAG
jgi:hypothetical protein